MLCDMHGRRYRAYLSLLYHTIQCPHRLAEYSRHVSLIRCSVNGERSAHELVYNNMGYNIKFSTALLIFNFITLHLCDDNEIDQMATVEVQNRLLNTDGKGFSNYIYNQLKEPNVPLFKTPEMALVLGHRSSLDQIFTIKNGKLSVDLSKIIWSSTDNTEYVKARDQVIWYLKVFKLPEGIDTRSAAELALMTHYRLYVAQPELQLANNGALGKKILKLSEFYEDMKVNYQEKMPAAQRQLAVQKMNVMIPLKGYERKEIEPSFSIVEYTILKNQYFKFHFF
ncbi:hypothetical protein DdX_19754 [Ditylenchus destructor]|uniref:Uncharacterized protein n=1 Tax=Ditylenchus destructor TaxID=166010 RepID=A0AAD4QU13_9BILA|nr:hypothetical protein DdX_19754 [Ditylenchus destructor]